MPAAAGPIRLIASTGTYPNSSAAVGALTESKCLSLGYNGTDSAFCWNKPNYPGKHNGLSNIDSLTGQAVVSMVTGRLLTLAATVTHGATTDTDSWAWKHKQLNNRYSGCTTLGLSKKAVCTGALTLTYFMLLMVVYMPVDMGTGD